MSYALYTYHWRANSIRKGGRGPYDDRLGPVSSLLHSLFAKRIFKRPVLDAPLRRASGSVSFYCLLPICSDPSSVSVIINFILRFTDGK
jgi:hypothetical protein